MMLLLLAGLASAASSKWEGANPDIRADGLVPAPVETTYAYVLDLTHLRGLFPEHCMGKIQLGSRTFGEGANAEVRYDMGMMHRRLAMTLARALPPGTIEFEHPGNRGFVTRWSFAEENGGTRVTLLTPLNPPPKPFVGYYYTVVQSEWQTCYSEVIVNLARAVAGSSPGTVTP